MNQQPKALLLADLLIAEVQTYPQMSEDEPGGYCTGADQLMDDAAAELRRLHSVNAELLEALKHLVEDTEHKDHNCGDTTWCPVYLARAAIAKAEGGGS